ncbi:hypothetical protein V8F33_006808 [Rhypophila sp. PSN 637]
MYMTSMHNRASPSALEIRQNKAIYNIRLFCSDSFSVRALGTQGPAIAPYTPSNHVFLLSRYTCTELVTLSSLANNINKSYKSQRHQPLYQPASNKSMTEISAYTHKHDPENPSDHLVRIRIPTPESRLPFLRAENTQGQELHEITFSVLKTVLQSWETRSSTESADTISVQPCLPLSAPYRYQLRDRNHTHHRGTAKCTPYLYLIPHGPARPTIMSFLLELSLASVSPSYPSIWAASLGGPAISPEPVTRPPSRLYNAAGIPELPDAHTCQITKRAPNNPYVLYGGPRLQILQPVSQMPEEVAGPAMRKIHILYICQSTHLEITQPYYGTLY